MRRVLPLLLLAACAYRPKGEGEERARAEQAGAPFARPFETRALPEIAPDASLDALTERVLLANADLERAYWRWRSALERVPQESTSPTTAAVSFETMLSKGAGTFLDRTSFTFGNDPMANLVAPRKLKVAGRAALEEARAAGLRFEKARLETRERVVAAWWEYALLAERIRLQEADVAFLEGAADVARARLVAAGGAQSEFLRANVEARLARNDLETLRARLPARRAELNALLSRPPDAPLDPPEALPPPSPTSFQLDALLARAADRNPELAALAREAQASSEGLELARLQYLPDFSLAVGLDPAEWATRLMGMATVPLLRRAAIEGRIAQARADRRAVEAMRRQVANDLAAQLVLQLYALENADRQIALFESAIVPEAAQAARALQASYAAGGASLTDALGALRVWVEARATLAEVRAGRETGLARIRALAVVDEA